MNFKKDWKYLRYVATKRLENNKTHLHVSKYGQSIEIIGAAGELAARRFFGMQEELSVGFDGGRDIIWRGYKVDVKSTRLTPKIQYRYLQFRTDKRMHSDIIMMCGVDLINMKAIVIGWVWGSEMLKAPINHNRDNACHEIAVPDLRPPWELYGLRKNKAYRRQEITKGRGK